MCFFLIRQLNVYCIASILIATLVKSQLPMVTSDNETLQINVSVGPASASLNLNLSENTISEETDTNNLLNSSLHSDELTRPQIASNISENVILTDDNLVPDVDVEDTVTEQPDITMEHNNLTVPPVTTDSSFSNTIQVSNIDSTNVSTESAIVTTAIITSPILANYSPITFFSSPSTNISPHSTAIPPLHLTTILATVTNSVVIGSNSLITTPSFTTTGANATPNTEATSTNKPPILGSSTSTSITNSLPSSIIILSQSTTTQLPTPTTTGQSRATVSPNLCGENEVYSCLPLCPRTCNNPLSKILCRPIPHTVSFCRRGCTCMKGYLVEKTIGKCVKKCPATRPR